MFTCAGRARRRRYRQLVDALVRYRAVLGMPHQEELLALLAAELTDDEVGELFMNLCPFAYEGDESAGGS